MVLDLYEIFCLNEERLTIKEFDTGNFVFVLEEELIPSSSCIFSSHTLDIRKLNIVILERIKLPSVYTQ